MKLGILGAMIEEVSLLKDTMVINEEHVIGGRTYYEGSLDGINIILSFSKWGKVASASTATTLINLFNIDHLVFTGVAGAVCEELGVGDVVIGSGLYQHDMDARPIFEKYQIPLTSSLVFEPREEDIKNAMDAAHKFLSVIKHNIDESLLAKYSILQPKIRVGMIASGDKFISTPEQHQDLAFVYDGKKTIAVEMEGASIAQICAEYGIPFTVIRTISDKADQSAPFDFSSFVSDIACHYSAGIIQRLITYV